MNQAYKLLKLNTGDDIVCKTEENLSLKDRQSIFIQDPMILNQIRMPYGSGIMESYTLSPWMAMADDDFYEIPVQYIVVAADIKENLKENYIKYVQDRKEAELIAEQSSDEPDEESDNSEIEKENNYENSQSTIRRRGRLVH